MYLYLQNNENNRMNYLLLQFALLETMMTAVQDTFPQLRAKKTYVVAVVCFIGFLGGLSVTCNVSINFNSAVIEIEYVSSWLKLHKAFNVN